MNSSSDSADTPPVDMEDHARLERRLYVWMILGITIAFAMSIMLAEWRVSTGILLGGSLALFNLSWLRASMASLLASSVNRKRVFIAARFLLRYLVIGLIVWLAVIFDLVSLPATIAGLSAFAVAMILEAIKQSFYIYREDS
ncbi:MAG: ATP synthase subunit I [Pyrinomonadaceae bacterium]